MMRRPKPDLRLLCCASVVVLSLSACTHQGGKLKSGSHLSNNSHPASTSGEKKTWTGQASKNGGRWLRKKSHSLASGAGGGTGSSSQYDNLWDRLFDLYDLPPIEHEAIDREMEWFVNHPDYIERVQQRAEPFLYSIVKQVEKHDIPGELALLPVIESAFQPHAVSPANAAGIWQFIPSTGRLYGLKRSRSYDGRRDIYASTRAAIKYLKKLHADFNGDWLLAIAAYNCGEGAVSRAIQRNLARGLPTDFWSLDLPQETRAYVPRLLAVAKLFAEADQYGINLRAIPNQAVVKPVKIDQQIDLALAADAADISLEKLYELNPGFKRQFVDVEGSYRLFIPAEKKTSEFKEELARLIRETPSPAFPPADQEMEAKPSSPSFVSDATEASEPEGATVAEPDTGDTAPVSFQKERRKSLREREPAPPARAPAESREPLRTVALHQHRSLDRSDDVRVDKPPVRGTGGTARAHKTEVATEEQGRDRSLKKAIYVVQPGETLWAVARKHAVDVRQLAKWNDFSVNTNVKAGQSLIVWNKDSARKLEFANAGIRPSQSIKYTVREGDTLFSISRRFKVSVADLRKWNGSNVEKQMQPGKNITVLVDSN
ncbi:Membrane-bound lytic murein transglycosylase D precursor [Candidatus Methylocalor cossyra]|uniref:Membrane-bound lytic murein transglycosylase D n=1 Tax=Candidatus Methylocalor cossyra TaxID=3108543 RepID=A0ABM9NF90_9GAMM